MAWHGPGILPEINATPAKQMGRHRVYKTVEVTETENGFGVALDGRALHTPGQSVLLTTVNALADAVAAEWDAQQEANDPASMPLTKLLNTTVDRIAPRRTEIVSELLQFVATDTLCYRAESPESLVERQSMIWQPVLDWFAATYGIVLSTGPGLMPVGQSTESVTHMDQVLSSRDDLALTAIQASAALTGSLVLALALVDQRLSGAEVFAIAQLDETWQMEQWGEDSEAIDRRSSLESDLLSVERFIALQR